MTSMCFGTSISDSKFVRKVRTILRRKTSSISKPRRACGTTQGVMTQTRPMISAPTSFYKDHSRDASITMSKLTEDHDSFVQSSKSSQVSTKVPSLYEDAIENDKLGSIVDLPNTALVVRSSGTPSQIAGFVGGLQLPGPRVSTMFKNVPWLQTEGDEVGKQAIKRRSVFRGR